jgi:hypothetical protein
VFERVLLVTVTACALLVTGLFVRKEFAQDRASVTDLRPMKVGDWRTFAQGSLRLGRDSASVTIVVFQTFSARTVLV